MYGRVVLLYVLVYISLLLSLLLLSHARLLFKAL
jgi:hypothetical protein